jgi:hypothetical protein
VTTKGLSMPGGMVTVGTGRPTLSFVASTSYSNPLARVPQSTSTMFPIETTLLTVPPEGSFCPVDSCYHPSLSPETSPNSSLMQISPLYTLPPVSTVWTQALMSWLMRQTTGEKSSYCSRMLGATSTSHLSNTAPIAFTVTQVLPHSYHMALTPLLSSLRSHCLACDCLRL